MQRYICVASPPRSERKIYSTSSKYVRILELLLRRTAARGAPASLLLPFARAQIIYISSVPRNERTFIFTKDLAWIDFIFNIDLQQYLQAV